MQTIKITPDSRLSIIDIDLNNYKDIQEAIGGHFETVKTQRLFDYRHSPLMLLVDEEGLLKDLPLNLAGCYFYGTDRHGCSIVGPILFAVPDGEYLRAPDDVQGLADQLMKDFGLIRDDEYIRAPEDVQKLKTQLTEDFGLIWEE